MCKIFAMTNMENVEVNSKFLNIVREEVTKYTDKDGFGYAVLGQDGSLGGERTIRPGVFRPLEENYDEKQVLKLPIVLRAKNKFGKINLKKPKSFIAHGRFSTNQVNLENTHPFTNGEVALIHNGVVNDESDKIKNLVTSCDTELLLRYWEMGGIKEIEENISGYYAIALLDKTGLLHIARDNRAMLHISWCRTVGSFIIATTPDIIKAVAKRMKWKIEQPEEILDNTYAVFDGNEILVNNRIKPPKAPKYMDNLTKKSLGWADSDEEYFDITKYNDVAPEEEVPPSYRELTEQEDEAYYSRYLEGEGYDPRHEEDEDCRDSISGAETYAMLQRKIG